MEGMIKVRLLEESDAGVFGYVNEKVCTQNIKQTGDLKECGEAAPDALKYIMIWKLADFLGMVGLMDFVMEKLYNAYSQVMEKEVQQMLYLFSHAMTEHLKAAH